MSFEEKLIECLSHGYFFNSRIVGIKRVRTLLTKPVDDYTMDKRLRFLFSTKASQVGIPSPKYFAINIGSLGWWTSDRLFKAEVVVFRQKIEEARAKFLANLGDAYFLQRFKEVANAHGLDPSQLINSIKFSLPARKILIAEANDSQKDEIVTSYTRDINGRILNLIRQTKTLLIKGVAGRKQRIETLTKAFANLQMLNVAGYRSDLIQDLSKAFGAIETLDKKNFPNDLDKYTNDQTLPKSIWTELMDLTKASQEKENWWLR